MKRHSGFGYLELVLGIVLIVLGILAFANPDLALTGLVFAYGVAAIVMGIADIVLYIQVERYSGFGPVLSLISGIMLVVYPGAGVLVLTMLFPIWFIAHCISRLTRLSHIRFVAGDGIYSLTLILNVIGLVLGFLMFLRPLLTLTAIRCLAGCYLLLLGIDSVAMAFSRLGRRP